MKSNFIKQNLQQAFNLLKVAEKRLKYLEENLNKKLENLYIKTKETIKEIKEITKNSEQINNTIKDNDNIKAIGFNEIGTSIWNSIQPKGPKKGFYQIGWKPYRDI